MFYRLMSYSLVFLLGIVISNIPSTFAAEDNDQTQEEFLQQVINNYKTDLSVKESRVDSLQTQFNYQSEIYQTALLIQKLNPSLDPNQSREIAYQIIYCSKKYSINPRLLLAISLQESRLHPEARGRLGEYGLFQVMPFWVDLLTFTEKPSDLEDISINIRAGAYIFNHYLKVFDDDVYMALLAYNRGPSAIREDLIQSRDPDNGYPGKVLAHFNSMNQIQE